MSFMKPLAQSGMFGLAGLAATAGNNKNKKTPPPSPSMISNGVQTATSLVNTPNSYGG